MSIIQGLRDYLATYHFLSFLRGRPLSPRESKVSSVATEPLRNAPAAADSSPLHGDRLMDSVREWRIVQAIARVFLHFFPSDEAPAPIPTTAPLTPGGPEEIPPEVIDDGLEALSSLLGRVDNIKTPEEILGEPANQLREELEQFQSKYPSLNKAQEALDTLKRIKQTVEEYNTLTDLRKVTVESDGRIKVPGDGNCLFHSISILLRFRSIDRSPDELRAEAVEQLRISLSSLNDEERANAEIAIDNAIEIANPKLKQRFAEESATLDSKKSEGTISDEKYRANLAEITTKFKSIKDRNDYLHRAAQKGFWGSFAEIFALSLKHDIVFEVWIDGQKKPEGIRETAAVLKHINDDHWDLVLNEKEYQQKNG